MTICLLLVGKLHEDQHHPLETFSLLSGIPIKQLVNLEQELLDLLDFKVTVTEEEITSFTRH